MKPGSYAIAFLAMLLAACATASAAEGDVKAIPALTARVSDYTGTLDPTQRQSLEDELAALEKAKGAQVGVLIVPTTQPEDIAQYTIRVFDAWKLGRKGIDDGVLVIVAKDDRRVRIEPARGLEAAIPDAAAARIIREYMAPRFRVNDYYGGIHDAVGALTKLINDEPLPPPLTDEHPVGGGDGGDRFAPAIIAAWFAALFLRGLFGGAPAGMRAPIVGLGAGGIGWFISGLLPLGLGLGVFGLVFGLLGGGGGGGFANRGGWGGFGGGGGGWSGGGGLGGGGFSGGGGISAGGGASGSW